ncbi:PREDICTED: protein lunapark-B [Nicrophorus vespilloides]|uniref:Endoplasmic reticulum junction formation protein lunapark n=1 Tax=Nicrophorus vespilloides TaxID=110193 RepID=A0ABM1NBQ0_NICVS|nr:PREDICTED: protein lunapark-B [Nicrophorus vespilloides]XP_017784251.1 PREDICTED: protein lunapark-B [Nicrophorus vespilloides]
MGLIIAKFRKKKTSIEILENLDKEIKSIEDFRRNTLERHKKIVGHFLIFSIGVYVVSCFLFYFYFYSPNIKERIFYFLPLLVAPVFIFSLKRLLTWYYNRKISKKEVKLVSLKNDKKKLLDTVMETETYKVARTILEKYAPEQVRKVNLASSEMTPIVARSPALGMQSGLRNRSMPNRSAPMMRQSIGFPQTPSRPIYGDLAKQRNNAVLASADTSQVMSANSSQIVPVVPMPRAILPKDRSVLQKMVEYLVGDGPYNRYALICKECYGHNGMALQEEYEYMSYKCCYCQVLNPARKKKPAAPKLGFDVPPTSSGLDDDTSESEKNSVSDSDSEGTKKPDAETLSDNNKEKSSDNEQPSDFDKLSDLDTKNSDGEQVEVQEEPKKEE